MTRRAELLVAVAAAALGAVGALIWWAGPLMLAGCTLLGAALGLARSRPRAACACGAAGVLLAAPDGTLPPPAFFYPAVLAFCAGRWDRLWPALACLVALVAAAEVGVAVEHETEVPPLLFAGVGWGAGRALRERELVAAQLAERVRELDEEREAYAALSVRYERARIASELHDIVAHAISVMVIQASAGQRLAARDPEGTAEAFDAIAGAARQAEEDMGRLVALLDDRTAGDAPDLALVEELVARAAGSGLAVTLRLEGDRDGLPATLAEAAYRVVQEGLTNALRYAAGAAVRVLVRGERGELVVEVANGPAERAVELSGVGSGNGLLGLRERVSEFGGSLTAGPGPDGGWCLRARMPRRVVSQQA